MRPLPTLGFCLAITVASAASGAPKALVPETDAANLVQRIQKFYESTTDLHAKFEQVLESGLGGVKRASGEVWLKKPGRMRWEYQKPEKKLMLADGQTLWVYEPEDEQAFRQDLRSSTLPSSVTFLWGAGNLRDEFDVSLLAPGSAEVAGLGSGDARDDRLLKLVPKKATAQYRYLIFVVDAKSAMVKETVVYDQQGGKNHMTFQSVETNRNVPDGKFHFAPPSGTRILKP